MRDRDRLVVFALFALATLAWAAFCFLPFALDYDHIRQTFQVVWTSNIRGGDFIVATFIYVCFVIPLLYTLH